MIMVRSMHMHLHKADMIMNNICGIKYQTRIIIDEFAGSQWSLEANKSFAKAQNINQKVEKSTNAAPKLKHNRNYSYKCTFTTLNGVGRTGPTNMDDYKGQCHENDTTLMTKSKGFIFKSQAYTGIQLQRWIVPKSGAWKIVCYGAKGGDSCWQKRKKKLIGGKGAKVGGVINLNKNDDIMILCGQMGESKENGYGGGGGGGTFFV